MSKPSIAELLNASGQTTYTLPLVMRAMYTLYGNIGANLDERNWSAIMQSSHPMETAESGLQGMYQDSGYLLRNTQHLVQSGYVAAQAEITYRQMADRLGFTYQSDWSVGTSYESLGQLSMGQLIALVPVAPPPPPLPTILMASSATGFTVSLNVAGTVAMSVSGSLGSFSAGEAVLTEQAAIKEGFVTLSSNGNTSAATSQYVVLGTAGDDSIDTSGAGNRAEHIFGGAGNDTIHAGNGNDVVLGGAGNDVITGGQGADTLYGGDGDDKFCYFYSNDLFTGNALVDTINGGAGTNALVIGENTGTQYGFEITVAMSWAGISNVSRIEAVGAFEAQFNIVLNDNAYEAGLRVVDLSADTSTRTGGNANIINVSAETGSANGYTLIGSSYIDIITGGAGNDTIAGGAGSDTITGKQGADSIALGAADAAVDQVIYTAPGETASGLFTSGGSTAGMDIISEASLGDVIDLWDVFSAAPTIGTAFLSAATANNAAIVQGTLNTVTGVFTAGADNDYMVQWADGTAVHSIVLKDFGVTAPTLTVNVANDTLTLAPVYNVINGTAGNDTLNGGAGYDMIIGGAGKDTMNGGDGDDVFIIASGADHGNTNNGEKIYGGNGVDVIRFTSTTPNDTLNLSYWIDVEEVRIVAADGSENSTAGLGINAVWLGVGPNIRLYGNAGNNTLVGNDDGLNTIEGGAGNDTIVGGFLADVLIGGAGEDTITGGAGADTFVFAVSASGGAPSATVFDTITDFAKASDIMTFGATALVIASGSAASSGTAGINAQGIATFNAADNTLALKIIAAEAGINASGTATAGQYAVFEDAGSSYIIVSDGADNIGAADVLIKLAGVTGLATSTLAGGNLTLA